MGLMKHFVAVLMSTHLVLSSPTWRTYKMGDRECRLCPAGEYQTSCTECKVCPDGSYTNAWNREDSCHRCYGDCSAKFHLLVVQNCSRTSDLKCSCESGFRCTEKSPLSENCRVCEKILDATTTAAAEKSVGVKQAPSSASSSTTSSTRRCSSPQCPPHVAPTADTSSQDYSGKLLAAILCPVVVMSCVAVVILFCFRRPGDETCFRQTIAKLCNKEGQNASRKSKESTHQFNRDSFGAKQQNVSAANLGSVHVHNPGTVIFSLLSQFTGQVGPTVEGGKPERRSSEEPDGGCPVFHPSSPHISEEEKSHEADSVFFPSQEQGKDFHVSKEEVL